MPGLTRKPFIVMVLCCFMLGTAVADPEDKAEEIMDDAHDVAVALESKGRFVAVPVPVSNPTVGTGLQAVLMYLHPKKQQEEDVPNSTSGIAAMYTDTSSWFTGAYHDDNWQNDKYRFRGFFGYGEFNLKYYGVGDNPVLDNHPIDYAISMFAFKSEIQMRLVSGYDWFAGVGYFYLDSNVLFKTSGLLPILPDIRGAVRTASVELLATYDSRNDNYYPTDGQLFQVKLANYDERWGSDYNYHKLQTYYNYYWPVSEKSILALRANYQAASGRAPFFDLPFLDMRGFSRDRYRDKKTLSLHAEGRYKFRPRWGVIAFVETGWFGKDLEDAGNNRRITSYGTGLRWQVTADKSLNLGLDLALSTDDNSIYIQIGEKY